MSNFTIRGIGCTVKGKFYSYIEARRPDNTRLYFGKDFFLACCARKSWEVRNGIGY